MSRHYTDAQLDAIDTTGCHLCVDAGAGSGKTMVLVERMLRLLESGKATLDEIVAITFTERAAGEMKERLRREAHARAPRDDAAKQTFWRDIERRADTARISTIHSFCMAILKEHALALGQDPDFAILNDAEGHVLRRESAEAAVHEALERHDDPAVRLAVEFGAKTLVEELARLMKERGKLERALTAAPYEDPQALLAHWWDGADRACMTKFVEARPEIERVKHELSAIEGCCTKPGDKRETMRLELLGIAAALLQATTPDEVFEPYLRLAELSAVGGSAKAWTSKDAFDSIKACRDALRDALTFMAARAGDPATEERAAQLTCDMASLYRGVAVAYQREKRQRAVMEFDDLILDTLSIVRDRDDIRQSIAGDIKFLLIDEFQDTDNLQLELAQRLAAEATGPELFFVGDAKQSIYYFRGAEVRVFDEARRLAQRTIPLNMNFRTTPDVLGFVNAFFAKSNLLQYVEALYRPMIPHRPATHEPSVELIMPPANEEKILAKESRRREAAMLAARIHTMCNGPETAHVEDLDTNEWRPARYGDIARLFRATNDLYLYEQALRARDIPYYVVAGSGFYQRQEILDLVNLLHVIVDPYDTYALFGFLRSPIAGISDEALLQLEWNGGFAQAFAQADYAGPHAEALRTAQTLIADLRAYRELPLPLFLRRVLEQSQYEAILLGQFLGPQKAANIRKMVDLAHQFGQTRASSLRAFLRYMDEMAGVELPEGEASMLPAEGNAVILMTIHKAKGLEFPIVFVPDLGRETAKGRDVLTAVHPELGLSLRPYDDVGKLAATPFHALIQQDHQTKEDAEHARILYVALTRARDRLVLSTGPDRCAKRSWMESILGMLDPLRSGDGSIIADPNGQCVVRMRQDMEGPPGTQAAEAVPQAVDLDAVRRHVSRIEHVPAGRRIFGVSEVLAQMMPHEIDGSSRATRASHDAMLRGEVVHRFFECWDFAAPVETLAHAMLDELDVPSPAHARYIEDLDAIARRTQKHAMGATIRDSGHAMRERPFILRIGDAMLRGEIDAVLSDRRVLDYKTGARRPDLEERYLWQLRLYAAAVDALDGDVSDEALLFYVDTGDVIHVDVSSPMRDQARARAGEAIAAMRKGIPVLNTMDSDHAEV